MTIIPSNTLPLTTITFPEIQLRQRDAHKLRGYFGELFREHSPLLHNHYTDGTYRQRYPLVQYKVLGGGVPTLVGLGEGAGLLVELFLRMRELDIGGRHYSVQAKHIEHRQAPVGPSEELHRYCFETLWLPLNQENHREYQQLSLEERRRQFARILTNNVLALLKAADAYAPEMPRLLVHLALGEPVVTQFKNQPMLGFLGEFVANVCLPDGLGLGKSVARGFGTVRQMK